TALADKQTANLFATTDPATIWSNITKIRDGGSGGVPSPSAQPFMGWGTGYATTATPSSSPPTDLTWPLASTTTPRGVNDTMLQSKTASSTTWDNTAGAASTRLLEPTSGSATMDPIKRYELLSKIMGNMTTRSNVYGVWATFGFFVVLDNT